MTKPVPIPTNVEALCHALTHNPGHAATELRQAILDGAAARSGRPPPEGQSPGEEAVAIPKDLASYLHKVTHHAYKVTDEEVAALIAAGYSEDQIFEITLCAAIGASLGRMERGLAAIKGAL